MCESGNIISCLPTFIKSSKYMTRIEPNYVDLFLRNARFPLLFLGAASLGLSALVAENSVQTEGGKHLCTLCGKVVRTIRQHIRGS